MDDVRQPLPPRDVAAVDTPPARGRGRAFLVLFAVLAMMGCGGVYYWLQTRDLETTDDAFIDGHVSQVAAQVAGRVVAVSVDDNQFVQAGQELVRVDPRDWQMRLEQAQARRAQAAAQLDQARATLGVRRADIGQADASVRVAEADRLQAEQDFDRYRAINPRAITRQTLDSATAALHTAAARLESARQAVAGMRAQLAVAAAQLQAATAAVQTADADIADAQLQLSYTRVLAPAPGRVARRTVELGNYINPGQALLAIVQPGLWVTANFKETQLARIRPGQRVAIRVDAFPNAHLMGHVDSLQAGTGSVFSALPAENATGNYVKVVQRLPAKIVFDGPDADALPLALGMSVYPRVDVRQ